MNLHKILAENMLRFGPKNLSESDIEHIKQLSEVDETVVNIVFASTSAEKMPNSQNVSLNGLVTPDATTYPDIEKVVFTATVSEWLSSKKSGLLSAFKPSRTTSTGMDVLKIGALGKDYSQGGSTGTGGIQFMSDSTDTIEASHNGLLVLARALETYIDAGRPASIKFILKMGQAKRWGAYINLKNINNLKKSDAKNTWESYVTAAVIPNGGFASNNYKTSFDGKTAEERIAFLNNMFSAGWLTGLSKQFPFNTTTGPAGVDYSTWVNNYFGKITSLNDFSTNATIQTDFETMFNKCKTHYYNAIKNDFYANVVNKTGIVIPEMEEILTTINGWTSGNVVSKATPIMSSISNPGTVIKTTGGGKGTSSEYELGKAKN